VCIPTSRAAPGGKSGIQKQSGQKAIRGRDGTESINTGQPSYALSTSGIFTTTNLPALPGSLTWNVQINPNDITLAIGSISDINGDGVVDTADLGILIAQFGTAAPVADLNNDNVVDTADLGILIGAFGTTCP